MKFVLLLAGADEHAFCLSKCSRPPSMGSNTSITHDAGHPGETSQPTDQVHDTASCIAPQDKQHHTCSAQLTEA